MTTIHTSDKVMRQLAKELMGYAGRKFKVTTASSYYPQNYWSGGSKVSAIHVSRENLKAVGAPPESPTTGEIAIPPGHFVIEHSIFCGKDMGITFIVRPDEVDPVIGSPDLSEDEKIVLAATRSFLSSCRFDEAQRYTGITTSRWNAAKESCIEKGLLNKRGAITNDGKNAVSEYRF